MTRDSRPPAVRLVVSVDTEEDNWVPSRNGITNANIERVPQFHAFLDSLGVRPTYFVAYQVSRDRGAAELISDAVARYGGEIGAHLHPWNTPPMEEELGGRNTMLSNLPARIQAAKLRVLTDTHEATFGSRPRCFRAGRFGLGPALIPELIDLGYRADSSVVPYWDWTETDGGPDFNGAPNDPYRLSRRSADVTVADPEGALAEVPVSCGFTRRPFSLVAPVNRWLSGRALRILRIRGILSRIGVFRQVILTPENGNTQDMVSLSRRLVEQGVGYLHLYLHSNSLKPGLTPFTPTEGDVERLMTSLGDYVEAVSRVGDVTFATVSDIAADHRGATALAGLK